MNEEAIIIELLRNVSKKDEDAFKELYELTHKRVFQYLYRLAGNKEMAEDIMIDTYTEVWKSARKFRGHSKVLTWITGIARNLAMNEFRRSKMKEDELDEDLAYTPDQLSGYEQTEISQILKEALNRLPVNHREILDLVFLQEMKYEDISQIINIPVSTVKTRVFYAKEKLRDILTEMGVKRDDVL